MTTNQNRPIIAAKRWSKMVVYKCAKCGEELENLRYDRTIGETGYFYANSEDDFTYDDKFLESENDEFYYCPKCEELITKKFEEALDIVIGKEGVVNGGIKVSEDGKI